MNLDSKSSDGETSNGSKVDQSVLSTESSDQLISGELEGLTIDEAKKKVGNKHIPSFVSSLESRRGALFVDPSDSEDEGEVNDQLKVGEPRIQNSIPLEEAGHNDSSPNDEPLSPNIDNHSEPRDQRQISPSPNIEQNQKYSQVSLDSSTSTDEDNITPDYNWVEGNERQTKFSQSSNSAHVSSNTKSLSSQDQLTHSYHNSNNSRSSDRSSNYSISPSIRNDFAVPVPSGVLSSTRTNENSISIFPTIRRESETQIRPDVAPALRRARRSKNSYPQAFPNQPERLDYVQSSSNRHEYFHPKNHLKHSTEYPFNDNSYDDILNRLTRNDNHLDSAQTSPGISSTSYYPNSPRNDVYSEAFNSDNYSFHNDTNVHQNPPYPRKYSRDTNPGYTSITSNNLNRYPSSKSWYHGQLSQSHHYQNQYQPQRQQTLPSKFDQPSSVQHQLYQYNRKPSIQVDSQSQQRENALNALESLESLEKLVAKAPNNLELHFLLAKTLMNVVQTLSKDDEVFRGNKKMQKSVQMAEKAIKCLKKVINESHDDSPFYAQALFVMGECYANGLLGLVIDHKRALCYYKKAEKLNHASSIYKIGFCYEVGAGVKADSQKAMQRYMKASALGDSAAMCKIGAAFLYGLHNFPRKPADAIEWFKRAIARNDTNSARGHYELAKCYEGDAGPISGSVVKINYQLSFRHYTHAAKLGFVPAQNKLGLLFEYGLMGLHRDFRKSIYWYSKAADRGDVDAQLALSSWYLTGAEGIMEQSDSQAFLWANKAAGGGNPRAAYVMGYMHTNGIGVSRDLIEGRKWYIRASNLGIKLAHSRVTEINAAISGPDHYVKRFYLASGRRIETRLHKKYGDPECQIT